MFKGADVWRAGEHDPSGGHILGEALTALLDRNPDSFRATDSGWMLALSAAQAAQSGLADFPICAPVAA